MAGEFGAFVNQKRKGRGAGGSDVLLRDLAEAIGISVSYLSDILKGRRSLPDMKQLDTIAKILSLSPDEKEEMLDLVGRERSEAAPDLPGYTALRKASKKGLGDDFWKRISDTIDKEE